MSHETFDVMSRGSSQLQESAVAKLLPFQYCFDSRKLFVTPTPALRSTLSHAGDCLNCGWYEAEEFQLKMYQNGSSHSVIACISLFSDHGCRRLAAALAIVLVLY